MYEGGFMEFRNVRNCDFHEKQTKENSSSSGYAGDCQHEGSFMA